MSDRSSISSLAGSTWLGTRPSLGSATRRLDPAARPLVMRDTDRDLTSVVVVRGDSDVVNVGQFRGRVVGTGAVDSPQATLLPLALLGEVPVVVRRYDVGVGLHGDHVGGERDAARALGAREVEAACMIDASHLLFAKEGILAPTPPGSSPRRRPTTTAT